MARIAIVGAGVLGQVYGARLLASGQEVLFVVRAGREGELAGGIRLHELRHKKVETYLPPEVSSRVDSARRADYIFVTVRGDQVDEAIYSIGPGALGRSVIFAPRWAAPAMDGVAARVAPGVAAYDRDGVLRYVRVTTRLSGREAHGVGALLERAGFRCKVVQDVAAATRAELAVGIPYAAAMEAAGFDFRRLRADGRLRQLAAGGAREAAAILLRTAGAGDRAEGTIALKALGYAPRFALNAAIFGGVGFAGKETREFVSIHTHKIRSQTRALLDELIERAGEAGVQAPSLTALRRIAATGEGS